MMENYTRELLVNFITGGCTAEEKQRAKDWINASPENEEAFIQLYENWQKAWCTQHRLIDSEKAFKRFIKENSPEKSGHSLNTWWIYTAASIILVCAIGLLWYRQNKQLSSWEEIRVAKGQKKEMKLPDGTTVWINAGSALRYDENFGVSNRNIQLEGEACFDIAKSKQDIPFIVQAGGFIIRDIGTVFNIKAYAGEAVFESSVLEGEISVEGKLSGEKGQSSKVFVVKNQVLRIKREKPAEPASGATSGMVAETGIKPLEIIDINPDLHIEPAAWTKDQLAFDNSSLAEIVRTLNRKFNKKIIVETQYLNNYHYSGTFKDARDVYKILDIIKETTPITYSTKGETIIIQ